MKTILQGWNFMRILRLVLAIGILAQGITTRDTVTIILAVVFGGMAVANIGCCGTGGCGVNQPSTSNNKTEDIHYEEVVSNK